MRLNAWSSAGTDDTTLPVITNLPIPSRNEIFVRILKISEWSIFTLKTVLDILQYSISENPQPKNKPRCTSTYKTHVHHKNVKRPDDNKQKRHDEGDTDTSFKWEVGVLLA
jgi:hypothetical protein